MVAPKKERSLLSTITRILRYLLIGLCAISGIPVAIGLVFATFASLFVIADGLGAPNAPSGIALLGAIVSIFTFTVWQFLYNYTVATFLVLLIDLGAVNALYKRGRYGVAIVGGLLLLGASLPFAYFAYYQNKTGAPTGTDVASYRVLIAPFQKGDLLKGSTDYALDSQHVYCVRDIMPTADPKSFSLLIQPDEVGPYEYAKDATHVYWRCNLIPGADPATFKLIGDSGYAVDFRNAYFTDEVISGANPTHFKTIGRGSYATDGRYVYVANEIVVDADAATFVQLEGGYSKDKNHIYFINGGSLGPIPGGDPMTFSLVNPPGTCGTQCYFDAKDRYQIYDAGQPVGSAR